MFPDTVNYHDVEATADAMHFLRDPLDCEQLGLTVVDADEEWTGKEHDHGDDDHEEVYLLLSGSATIEVEGESVPLTDGDAVRVESGEARQVEIDEGEATLVIAGAP